MEHVGKNSRWFMDDIVNLGLQREARFQMPFGTFIKFRTHGRLRVSYVSVSIAWNAVRNVGQSLQFQSTGRITGFSDK